MKLIAVEGKGEGHIKDLDTGLLYGRVVAGLAWPKSNVPGAVVALAESLTADPVDGMRLLRLAAWETTADVEQLLEQASLVCPWVGDSRSRSLVSVWVGDPWHPFTRRLKTLNARLTAAKRPRIQLRAAPGVGNWQLVADWAPYFDARTVGRRGIVFGNKELIAQIVDAGVDARRPIADFPSVAATFWAIAACDERARMGREQTSQSGRAGDSVAGY